MDSDRCEDSGEMYSPNDQGEYMLLDEAPQFSMQGLFNALADVGKGTDETPVDEYAMMLEVTMADRPGRPHPPPTFSWNAGMVMHVLKSDPVLRELEHVQGDGPGTAYLFFYDKQGCQGLGQDATHAIQTHVEEAFSEWISHSAYFNISLFPLMEAWQRAVAASDCQRLRGQAENPVHNIPVITAEESNSSSQLVGSAPQQARRASGVEEVAEARLTSHTGAVQSCGRPPKSQYTMVGGGGLPPSSPDRRAPDSDGYSTASETTGCRHRCRGCRGSREKKWLAPVRLDMLIFKSTDPGAEVTYTLWRFDVDAFLKQYDETSMHPHNFASLRGYPSKWAHTLDEGKDISMQDLLMHMEKTFGNKRDYDAMIKTLYEVQQRKDETVEEYMLRIHDTVAVICHTYPECLPDWGRDLKKNTRSEVNVCMIRWIWNPLLEAGGPASHWIGPETLVDLTIEGRNVNALVDSGSQVNMITPTLVQQYGFPVLPLKDLVDYPLNLVGLGRKCTKREIVGYDEDVVFLMVPNESEFGWRVPLVVGTCTIGRIINVIQESEIDCLSTPWATARMVQLLSCWRSMAVPASGGAEIQVEGASGEPPDGDVDELVMVRERVSA